MPALMARVFGADRGVVLWGRPAAQIGLLMHRELVDGIGLVIRKTVFLARPFLVHVVCPGPEAMQLATYGRMRAARLYPWRFAGRTAFSLFAGCGRSFWPWHFGLWRIRADAFLRFRPRFRASKGGLWIGRCCAGAGAIWGRLKSAARYVEGCG